MDKTINEMRNKTRILRFKTSQSRLHKTMIQGCRPTLVRKLPNQLGKEDTKILIPKSNFYHVYLFNNFNIVTPKIFPIN